MGLRHHEIRRSRRDTVIFPFSSAFRILFHFRSLSFNIFIVYAIRTSTNNKPLPLCRSNIDTHALNREHRGEDETNKPTHRRTTNHRFTVRTHFTLTGLNVRANKNERKILCHRCVQTNIRPDDSGLPTISIQMHIHLDIVKIVIWNDKYVPHSMLPSLSISTLEFVLNLLYARS